MANIITLTGQSQCGKSTVINLFMESENEFFRPERIKKYTTRKGRANDEDVICKSEIPPNCDILYEQYGNLYGLDSDMFYKMLRQGKTSIVVINDIRAIEDLRSIFGDLIISLFLYRKPADLNEFEKEEKERVKETKGEKDKIIADIAKTRYEKAQAISRIYIENIQMFDHVILNIDNHIEYTKTQIRHIIEELTEAVQGLKKQG
jgi:guanylate kinase